MDKVEKLGLFGKKFHAVEALQLKRSNKSIVECLSFMRAEIDNKKGIDLSENDLEEIISSKGLSISTLEGDLTASFDDYIIKGIKGEFYPCKPDIFHDSYDEILEGDLKDLVFSEALNFSIAGSKIQRSGWNGKGMFVVYQKGYPNGIPCNKQTAEAWVMEEGELFKCEPYLQIKMVNGSHSMWVPSINDLMAGDWQIVE